MCLRFVFLLITRTASWLELSRRQETWRIAEIGSDQQGCGPSRLTVMITGHVPAVRFSPGHADRLMAGAVPAPGDVADCRDLDPAPPARRAAAAPAAPSGTEPGGPGTARDPAQRDTEGAAAGPAAAGDPGRHAPLAPRHLLLAA